MVKVGRNPVGVIAIMLVATSCGGSSSSTLPVTTKTVTNKRSVVESKPQTIDSTITTPDGRKRSYRVYVPASLPKGQPVPLLLALHGGGGSGQQFETNSEYDALAAANRFIVVYPDGIEIGGRSILAHGRVWNGGRCCGPAAAQQVDDVGFLSTLIDRISKEYEIDPKRVYATGHSNGAIMSYRLACELSEKIVAIGVQAGSLEVDACNPSRPVSVIHIHGTADKNIPIGGGKGSGISGIAFRPPLDAAITLARANGCPNGPTESVLPDNADVTVAAWQPCADGTAVEFVKVNGASHAWMGHASSRAVQALAGAPYMSYDSSAAIWAFLAAHPRR